MKKMGIENTLHEMLEPYIPECRYLKEAELDFPEVRGKFSIPNPFYCIGTGHFNAVEAIICYNQLGYTMVAEWIAQGLIGSAGQIPLEEYKKLQAQSSYIARIDKLKFSNPIDATDFYGMISLEKTLRLKDTVFLSTKFKFWDENKGKATGSALSVIVLKEQPILSVAG